MNYRLAWVIVACVIGIRASAAENGAEIIEVKRISDRAGHSAFTDLLRFKGTWYCVFREGSAHIPGTDGVIRVLSGGADGAAWESAAVIAEKGVDLRDPKLSVMPDGRLMIVMGGSVYDGAEPTPKRKLVSAHSRVSFSNDGVKWSSPAAVEGVGQQWLWRVTWQKGVGYGAVYSTGKSTGKAGADKRRVLSIWRTADGVKYERPIDPAPGIDLTEATIRFGADDSMVVLLRGEEKDRHAWIGVSRNGPDYDKWEWHDGGRAAQGPDFVVSGKGVKYYAGRDFDEKGMARTVVGRMTAEKLEVLARLPSGGDTSYAGMVYDDEARMLWVSYYSSHEGKTAIYLAKVRMPEQ